MDSATIGNIIATVTALIAVAALICQSHTTSNQIKLQNFIEFTKRYQEIILNFPENINNPDFSLESMSAQEKSKTLRYMRAYFDLCFEEFTLHNKGFIDSSFWEIWRSGMEFAFSKTAFKQGWNVIIKDTKFSTEFERFVGSHIDSSCQPVH